MEKMLAAAKASEAKDENGKGDAKDRAALCADLPLHVRKCRFAGREVYYVSGQPIAPAACVTDGKLVLTLNMPAMKAYLLRKEHRSLAEVSEVRAALTGPEGPAALCYCDTPRLFDVLYPMFSVYANMGAMAAQKAGLDLDPTFWPSAAAIRPHLKRDVAALRRTPHGLELVCRYCLPTGGVNGPLWLVGTSAGAQTIAFAACMPRNVMPLESSMPPPWPRPPQSPDESFPTPPSYTAPACPPPGWDPVEAPNAPERKSDGSSGPAIGSPPGKKGHSEPAKPSLPLPASGPAAARPSQAGSRQTGSTLIC
jgi:hypothetical protein